MDRFEELEDEAFTLGIKVIDTEMPVSAMDAAYLSLSDVERIFLRHSGTSRECVRRITEEHWHHHTRQKQSLNYYCIDDWRVEAHARRWVHARRLSPDAIHTTARNTNDIYEIAETLDVSVELLRESIRCF